MPVLLKHLIIMEHILACHTETSQYNGIGFNLCPYYAKSHSVSVSENKTVECTLHDLADYVIIHLIYLL